MIMMACAGSLKKRTSAFALLFVFFVRVSAKSDADDVAQRLLERGSALQESGDIESALQAFERSAEVLPSSGVPHVYAANLHATTGNYAACIRSADRALGLLPGSGHALRLRGQCCHSLGDAGCAVDALRAYLDDDETEPDAHDLRTLGIALRSLGKLALAEKRLEASVRVAARDPSNAGRQALMLGVNELQTLLLQVHRPARLKKAKQVLAEHLFELPSLQAAQMCNNLAVAFMQRGDARGALGVLLQAVELEPEAIDLAPARINAANLLVDVGQMGRAVELFKSALGYEPQRAETTARLVHLMQRTCDWNGLEALERRVRLDLLSQLNHTRRKVSLLPLHAQTIPSIGPKQRRALARSHVAGAKPDDLETVSGTAPRKPPRGAQSTLRVVYLSSDMKEHPIGDLMVGVFAQHTRRREVNKDEPTTSLWSVVPLVFALNPPKGDEMVALHQANLEDQLKRSCLSPLYSRRAQIACAVGRGNFFDMSARELSDGEIASKILSQNPHVVIDLNGMHSRYARPGVLAVLDVMRRRRKPGKLPVLMSFLGYPHTTGANFVDHFVTDATVAPPDAALFDRGAAFSERVAYLPRCFLPSSHALLSVFYDAWRLSLRRLRRHASFVSSASRSMTLDGTPESKHLQSLRQILGREQHLRRDGSSCTAEPLVLANFGQHLKISPATLDTWANALRSSRRRETPPRSLDGGVQCSRRTLLWLLEFPKDGEKNLRRELRARGVPDDAVVFTPMTKRKDVINAHALADLVLDTPLYNGGATSLDVAWAGVPALTLPAAPIAPDATPLGRMGASIGRSAFSENGISAQSRELLYVADTLKSYEAQLFGLLFSGSSYLTGVKVPLPNQPPRLMLLRRALLRALGRDPALIENMQRGGDSGLAELFRRLQMSSGEIKKAPLFNVEQWTREWERTLAAAAETAMALGFGRRHVFISNRKAF